MTVFINCCMLGQISYLEKCWFQIYEENAHGQSDCRVFESITSLEQNDEKNLLFAC